MSLTPIIPSPDDLKRTMGTQPPMLGGMAKPDGGPPSLGPLPALSGNAAPPDMASMGGLKPIVTNPRQQQEQALQQKISSFENPAKPQGFWQKLAHVVAQNPYTQAFEHTQNAGRVSELAGLQTRDMQEQDATSRRGLEGAQTQEAQARADALENPVEKSAWKVNPDYVGPNGEPIQENSATGELRVAQGLPAGVKRYEKPEVGKSQEHLAVINDAGQQVEADYHPDTGKVTDMAGNEIKNPRPIPPPAAAGAVTMIAPDPNTPGGGIVQRLTPGSHVAPGSTTPTQAGSQNVPTSQMRNMGEMAATIQPQMNAIIDEVQQMAQSVGPAVGRWNQLMVNKGGKDFPEFAGLDTDLDLLASAIVRTHFGARGGQQYREELRKQFGEAQSPEDLVNRIQHAEGWIKGYAAAGGAKSPAGSVSGPMVQHSPSTGQYRYSTDGGRTWQAGQPPKGQ